MTASFRPAGALPPDVTPSRPFVRAARAHALLALGLGAGAACGVLAQGLSVPGGGAAGPAAGGAAANPLQTSATQQAQAQTQALTPTTQQSLSIVPTLSVRLTATDNATLSSTDRHGDTILEVGPGVQLTSRSGLLRGTLNASVSGFVSARDAQNNAVRNYLSANGNADVVPGRAGVAITARVGQQAISAFATQSPGPVLEDANRAEVATYSLAPYIQGRMLGNLEYKARVTYSASHSSGTKVGDMNSLVGSAEIAQNLGRVGWGADIGRSRIDNSDRPLNLLGRAGVSGHFQASYDWRLTARAARESNDVRFGFTEYTNSWGLGATWAPSVRTLADLKFDRRFFGNARSLSFSHRMPRSLWTFSDTRDYNSGGATGQGAVSRYDLLFAQYASIEPDPVKRDELVRRLLDGAGGDGIGGPGAGFLSSSAAITRRRTAGMSYLGLRTTVSLTGFRSASTRFGQAVAGEDLASADTIRQYGLTLSLAHRLTPVANLTLAGSWQRTPDSGAQPGNELRVLTAGWSSQMGPYSQLSLSVRRAVFDSETNPYHESAFLGSLSMRF